MHALCWQPKQIRVEFSLFFPAWCIYEITCVEDLIFFWKPSVSKYIWQLCTAEHLNLSQFQKSFEMKDIGLLNIVLNKASYEAAFV